VTEFRERRSSPSPAGSGCRRRDGQVTMGNVVLKHTAKKIRRLHDGHVVAGFAGGTADAFTLFEKFEAKLSEFRGNLRRPPWNWRRIGARTACCGGSRR